MPVRYYYMSGCDKLVYREGTTQYIRCEWQMDTENVGQPVFREHSAIGIFLSDEELAAE